MTKRWTDEDVKRLVEVAEGMDRYFNSNTPIYPQTVYPENLTEALQPFRPDPEEELLNEMASAMNREMTWHEMSKAALAVIKEKGHYAASHGDSQQHQ